jgi:hypothetical protein
MDLSTAMQANEEIVTTSVNDEVKETLNNPPAPNSTPPDQERNSDTPSPIQFCEGQIYSLNKSMQFVRIHAKIGDKFLVTSRGLGKMEESDTSSNMQILTLWGKFSFKFESE